MSKKKKEKEFENIDEELIDYIKHLKFKHRVLGVDQKEIWTVVSNIQKFYARKELELEMKYKALLEEREEKIKELEDKNAH